MPAKRYSVEQIVAKLREHEKLQGQARFPRPASGSESQTRPSIEGGSSTARRREAPVQVRLKLDQTRNHCAIHLSDVVARFERLWTEDLRIEGFA